MEVTVYVVQGDPRDHHGGVLLVTCDREAVDQLCANKLLEWNKPLTGSGMDSLEASIHRAYATMDRSAFLDKYLGNAWISTPQLSEHVITVRQES
jgi:hypothetical protein